MHGGLPVRRSVQVSKAAYNPDTGKVITKNGRLCTTCCSKYSACSECEYAPCEIEISISSGLCAETSSPPSYAQSGYTIDWRGFSLSGRTLRLYKYWDSVDDTCGWVTTISCSADLSYVSGVDYLTYHVFITEINVVLAISSSSFIVELSTSDGFYLGRFVGSHSGCLADAGTASVSSDTDPCDHWGTLSPFWFNLNDGTGSASVRLLDTSEMTCNDNDVWIMSCSSNLIDCEDCGYDKCFKVECSLSLKNSSDSSFSTSDSVEYSWDFSGGGSDSSKIAYCDSSGNVVLETDCLGIDAGDESGTVTFAVSNIVKSGLIYNENRNACSGCSVSIDPPLDCCSDLPIPNPATFSTAPTRYLYNGTWYHYMTATEITNRNDIGYVSETECGCVEYRFICVEDGSKTTGWRNVTNVAGLVDPTGSPEVPRTVWIQVTSAQHFNWKCQYRGCGCDTPGTESSQGYC